MDCHQEPHHTNQETVFFQSSALEKQKLCKDPSNQLSSTVSSGCTTMKREISLSATFADGQRILGSSCLTPAIKMKHSCHAAFSIGKTLLRVLDTTRNPSATGYCAHDSGVAQDN